MHAFHEAKELIEKEVKKIVDKGSLTPTELESIKCAAETYDKIEQMEMRKEMGMDEGYSDRRGGRMSRDYGRSMNMMRDPYYPMPMDRSYADQSYGGRSYDDRGMSRTSDVSRTIDVLESMLRTAGSEKERRAIENHIEELRR